MGWFSRKLTITEYFINYESYIFTNIVWPNLFVKENQYSDLGMYDKVKSYIKTFFEKNNYNFDKNEDLIKKMFYESESIKYIGSQLKGNYEYFIKNPIKLEFIGHFPDWCKKIVDESLIIKKPLTMQYARMVVSNYYYKSFKNRGTNEALYKNIIAMISSEEFASWINCNNNSINNIVHRIKIKFKRAEIIDYDERILIKQIFKSKLFQNSLNNFNFIKDQIKTSEYHNLYDETIKEINSDKIDLHIKNVEITQTKRVETKSDDKELKNNQETNSSINTNNNSVLKEKGIVSFLICLTQIVQQKEKGIVSFLICLTQIVQQKNLKNNPAIILHENAITEPILKEKKNSFVKAKLDDPLDNFLYNIGGKNKHTTNNTIDFLNSIQDEITYIKSNNTINNLSNIERTSNFDEDIEELKY